MLFLTEPVDIAENVNTVCLPSQSEIYDHSLCFASGWGKDLFGKEGKYQVILKRVPLPIVPREPCIAKLRNTRLGAHFQLHNSFICAGGEKGIDTCKGDGGSPLVCPVPGHPGRYAQAGIVSWGKKNRLITEFIIYFITINIRNLIRSIGIGCGENETPGVYVNVPIFRQWIDEQLNFRSLNQHGYSIAV